MNCLSFRRLLLARPVQFSAEQQGHVDDCPACARAAARGKEFETLLREAFDVPVPVGLEARIMQQRERQLRRWLWAMMAVCALGVGVLMVTGVETHAVNLALR